MCKSVQGPWLCEPGSAEASGRSQHDACDHSRGRGGVGVGLCFYSLIVDPGCSTRAARGLDALRVDPVCPLLDMKDEMKETRAGTWV